MTSLDGRPTYSSLAEDSLEAFTEQASSVSLSNARVSTSLLGFVPGAVGGFCNVLVGHPLDLVKVRLQCQPSPSAAGAVTMRPPPAYSSTSSMLRSILVTDGLVGLYAGVTAPLLAVVPAFGITFCTFDATKSYILSTKKQSHHHDHNVLTLQETALCGGLSGIPLALVLGPLEKIKCEFQVNSSRYKSLSDCLRQTYATSGWRGVFRGTSLTMARDVPGNAAYFCGYEFMRRKLCELEGCERSITSTLVAGGCAGVCNWIVAIPFDVIKSQWQVAPVGMYASPMHLLRHLLHTEGVTALFRGLSPALLRAFPSNAACLLGVETMRSLLHID